MPINNWASDLVKNGALGKVLTVLAPNFVGPFRWTKTSTRDVKGPVQPWWDLWTNQAELRPLEDALLIDWARWRDYDGGGLCFGVTGWGAHSYDQINRALGTDDTGPLEVLLEEPVADRDTGKFASRKTVGGVIIGDTGDQDTGTEYHPAAKLTGPRAKITMKFASGTELKLHLDGDRGPGLGAIFSGEKGKIEINRNKLASNPKEIVRAKDNPGPIRRPETAYHIENFTDCVKSRKRCNADIEIGLRATTLCHLVNIARDVGRVGRPLAWDPAAERFTNCPEANHSPGAAAPRRLRAAEGLGGIIHRHVGWVEQTAHPVGVRSLAGYRFPGNLEFKRDAVCEDPPEVARTLSHPTREMRLRLPGGCPHPGPLVGRPARPQVPRARPFPGRRRGSGRGGSSAARSDT